MTAVAATVVASVAAGVALERRLGGAAQRLARGLLAAMLFGALPVVTFFNVARLTLTADVGGGILLAYCALALTGLVGWAIGRRALRLRPAAAGAVANSAMLANTGYLGLPLTVALLGPRRLGEAVAYDSLVSGPVLLIAGFGVGAALGERAGEGSRARLRAFLSRNPPLLAAVAALIAPDWLAPDAAVHATRYLVLAVLPVGFIAVGALLSAESSGARLSWPPALTPGVSAAVVLRLLAAPALLIGLSAPLIALPAPYLLLAAMPSGINSLAVAHVYGLDLSISAGAIAWSTGLVVLAGLVAVSVL